MEEEIFKKSNIIVDKLIEYGFEKKENYYTYQKDILNKQFKVIIKYKNNKISGKIIDKELNEELLNYRVKNYVGDFINKVKDEYINILKDIKNKCCINNSYSSPQANRISELIKEKYNDNPEFLWDDDKNSVFRNPSNKKWYGIIMNINIEKIGRESIVNDVMNVKLPKEMIEELLKTNNYYKAYHMNKKYWITFILDDSISDEEIMKLIEISHSYTEKK